jgi:hypothetical protein
MVRGRYGIVLAVLGAMAFTLSHMGCGSSSTSSPLPGGTLNTANITLINNCGGSMNVLVNANGGVWLSNGQVRCASGTQCPVAPGTYAIDVGSNGLDFFVGAASDNATKAEVTYVAAGFNFDISTIPDSGNCPTSCTSASCCTPQAYNVAVKITPSTGCRCAHCDSVTCLDGMHYPDDGTKQINCASQTDLTVEFCPASACTGTGVSNCTTAQNAICNNPSDQPCTGDMVFCCPMPAYGGTHTCYCATANPSCATIPDTNGPCGSDLTKYCYVTR